MLWSAVKEILLRLTLSIRMRKRYHKAKFGIFFFLQREEKKLQQLHYLWVDNSKLGTHFCTAHCLQTESIHRDRLSLSRIKADWPIVYILSPATKPGTHPSSVSPNPLLIKPRSYRAPSQPPSFSGEPAQVQHQPHATPQHWNHPGKCRASRTARVSSEQPLSPLQKSKSRGEAQWKDTARAALQKAASPRQTQHCAAATDDQNGTMTQRSVQYRTYCWWKLSFCMELESSSCIASSVQLGPDNTAGLDAQ